MLEVFKNNAGTGFWINQSFYDQKTYLNYVSTRVYEKMDSAKYDFSVDSTSFETFSRSSGSITVPKDYPSHNEHSPAFNGYESAQGSGYYKAITFSAARKEANGKRMLNVAYKGMNGSSNDTTMANAEGYKYRGRGFVQVTGKTNYENAQETCKQHFGVTYNFVSQPQSMEENVAGVWASFAWFVKNVKLIELDTQNPDIITYKVNARGLEKDNRRANYVQMRNNLFKCNSR